MKTIRKKTPTRPLGGDRRRLEGVFLTENNPVSVDLKLRLGEGNYRKLREMDPPAPHRGAEEPLSPVLRFFHLLGAVAPPRGAVLTDHGPPHRTLYACCMDGATGRYHVITEQEAEFRSAGFNEEEVDTVL